MRVGFDATSVSPSGKGIARVQRSTVEALVASGRHEWLAFVRDREAAVLLERGGVECVVTDHRLAVSWEQAAMPRAFRRYGLGALITLTDRLPLVGGGPTIVWLFEVPRHRIEQNRLTGAGAYQRGSDLLTSALWKRSLRRAARVASGSDATADEIRDALPGLDVRTIYPGLDPGFGPGPGRPGPRYVFHLSSSDPRDNTETVLRAFARVRGAVPVRLLVGGGLGERGPELQRLAGDGVEFLGRVSDAELVELYRGAAAYLDATLFEGFGYQALEALACGAPFVGSNTTSIPEVVGGVGVLCDPRSEEELAAGLLRVLEDAAFASGLRERGFERAATFTWERTAGGFLELVEGL